LNLLAIDCGTKTGWASLLNGECRQSGVQSFELKRGESSGMRFIRFNAWFCEMLDLVNPKITVYEMAHLRGGHASEVLQGMVTLIQINCAKKNIQYTSVHSMSLKKFATGSGKASKDMMLKLAKEKFHPGIIDDNEADALWILEWAIKEFKS